MFFSFQIFSNLIIIILSTICLLIIIAFYTVAERKIMASIQRRQGPHKIGFLGLLQAFADALKLIAKELLIPLKTGKVIFICAPWLILALSLLNWSVIPLSCNTFIANINYSINFILAISSLNVYCIIMAGWSSNSKYSFFGAIRSVSQMLSYEVVISVLILSILLISNSLNFVWINILQFKTIFFVLPLILLFIIFLIIILAETNRTPFDLPEAEAELVAGYNLEYSSIIFALFFLAEYANMLLMSVITTLFFFGYDFSFVTDWIFNINFSSITTKFNQFLEIQLPVDWIDFWRFDLIKQRFIFLIRYDFWNWYNQIFLFAFDNHLRNIQDFHFINEIEALEFYIDSDITRTSYKIIKITDQLNNLITNQYEGIKTLLDAKLGLFIELLEQKYKLIWELYYKLINQKVSFIELSNLGEVAKLLFIITNFIIWFLGCLFKSWVLLIYCIIQCLAYILILLCCIYYIVIRATLPRYRYDHLLMITWKCIMPFSFAILLVLIALFI